MQVQRASLVPQAAVEVPSLPLHVVPHMVGLTSEKVGVAHPIRGKRGVRSFGVFQGPEMTGEQRSGMLGDVMNDFGYQKNKVRN